MAESVSEAAESVSGVARTLSKFSFKYDPASRVIELAITTDSVELIEEFGGIVVTLGSDLYVGYKLLQPVIEAIVKKVLGPDVQIAPGNSLHVLLSCKTDERFLEALEDYE